MPAAQTIKQAKASFAARGRPSLNLQEQRQLERGLELEQRAERAKEQEKRRAAAAKKRAENEKKGKSEREKTLLGTQRRKDRFGYVSSQFHLGAFLVGGKNNKAEKHVQEEEEEEEDLFGDDGLDDEVMLNALNAPNHAAEHAKSDSVVERTAMPPPAIIRRSQSAPIMDDLMGDFWDDMESSTQIARELSGNEVDGELEMEMEKTGKSTSTRSASFGSIDFDLTAEDLDDLDPPRKEERTMPSNKTMTPPPPPPPKVMMPPPAIPTRQIPRNEKNPIQPPPSRSSKPLQPSAPKASNNMMQPPLPKPISAMPPPARTFPKMPPPAKPVARATIPNPEFSTSETPTPQIPIMPPPPRRLQDQPSQPPKSRTAIKGT